MTALAYASHSSDTAAALATNCTPAKPAGTADRELLVAFCWTTTTGATWSSPDFTPAGNNAGVGSSALLYRKATSSEPASYTFTRAASTAGVAGVIVVRLTGDYDDASPIDTTSFGLASGTTSIVIDSQSPVNPGDFLLHFATRASAAANSWTPPGTTTERVDAASSGAGYSMAIGDEVLAAAGATGTRTWTYTASGTSRAGMISIKAAAAPANTGGGFLVAA